MAKAISVSQYAKSLGKSAETVRLWIVNDRLPKGVKAEKIGNYYAIYINEK
jgi:DNA-binding transcriptional regulator YiaG